MAWWEKWLTWCSVARARRCYNNGGKGVGWGVRLVAAWRKGWRGVGSVTRGVAVEEEPGRQPRPRHGGHRHRTAAHVVSRGMSERES
jgi:hypothetical protein